LPEPLKMPEVRSFQEVLGLVPQRTKPHLLLGNGFSRACRNDIFAYDALFNRSDFTSLSSRARSAFDRLGTTDFEIVMKALRNASVLVELYDPESRELSERLLSDGEGLREVLVGAIAGNHPALPSEIGSEAYSACKLFLSHFNRIYTLNYDLLLYWAVMQDEIPPDIPCDDGFRMPEGGPQDYVTWEPENTHQQNIYYLHGALHIFDAGREIQKYTWSNTRTPLIGQIRTALEHHKYPLFVAEGESGQKLERIRHSDYLSKAYRSFAEIGGSLFIFGHSLAPNDEHYLRLIEKGKVKQVFVGIYGDPVSQGNTFIINRFFSILCG
jgi:hypothetical protein